MKQKIFLPIGKIKIMELLKSPLRNLGMKLKLLKICVRCFMEI